MYTLDDFTNISFKGFSVKLPNETIQLIQSLAEQVGSPTYIKTPVFEKKEPREHRDDTDYSVFRKKRRGRNHVETVNDEDWENLRSFQATKIEQKVGIDIQFDQIRSCLNKMSDKNYNEQSSKIIEILNGLVEEKTTEEDMNKIGNAIFEVASNNRFYSKIYADLYTQLIHDFEIMGMIFEENLKSFLELFDTIECVDPAKDYDGFCKNNLKNEKRKSLSTFFVNLHMNKMIPKQKIVEITNNLMSQVYDFMNQENKKSEVEEMTENIALLYTKEIFEGDVEMFKKIETLAKSKSKDFLSLSNKAIFKYMDMIDM